MDSIGERQQELLVTLLYEDGPVEEIAEARALLGSDEAFRAEFQKMNDTQALLGAWPNVANAPRMVYVTDQPSLVTRVRRWVDELGALGLRSLLRPAAGLAAALAVVVVASTFLRFEVGPDGVVKLRLPGAAEPEVPAMVEQSAPAESPAGDTAAMPITRAEFNQGLADMAGYIDQLVQNTRREDRQTLLATLEQRLGERDVVVSQTLLGAVQTAFDELDAKHTREYATVLATLQDMQIQNATELGRMNSILAALLQPQGREEEE